MSSKRNSLILIIILTGTLTVAWVLGIGGCSTSRPLPPIQPPPLTQVIHPQGMDMGDLAAIFMDPSAPQDADFIKNCDADFKKLKNSTVSIDEIRSGIVELVVENPVNYHWCFYGKILELDTKLKSQMYVDERQKETLDTFEFLTPVAKAFNSEFHDSRYLRWAVAKYQKISEWIFYRRLEMNAEGTAELVEASSPLGFLQTPGKKESVLQKYHLGGTSTYPASVATGGPAEFVNASPSMVPQDQASGLPMEQAPNQNPPPPPAALGVEEPMPTAITSPQPSPAAIYTPMSQLPPPVTYTPEPKSSVVAPQPSSSPGAINPVTGLPIPGNNGLNFPSPLPLPAPLSR